MTEKETCETRPHSEWGPSGLKNLKQCRGFKNHGNKSAASEKGDRIHWALENRNPAELVDEDEYEIYAQCLADMDKELSDLADSTGVKPAEHQEIRLHIDLGAIQTFGTADMVAIAGNWALLHDHKSGISHIDPPPENWQSKAYAVGVFQRFPEVKHIRATFSVPARGELLDGEYHRELLPEYIREIGQLIVEAAYVRQFWLEGQPPVELLSPGDQCRFCIFGQENKCPALGAIVYDIVMRYDGGGLLPPDGSIHGSEIDDPEVLAKLLPIAKIAEKWASGIKSKATATGIRDGGLPGYRLKSMGSPREVSDVAAMRDYAEGCGFSIEDILAAATFSLSKLSEVVKKKAPRGQKGDAVREFEDGLETFGAITRKAERFSLQPLTGGDDDE